MARKMVCEWGMSELGPLSFGKTRRADLPGPRDRAASRLQRGHGDPHRRAGQEAGGGRLQTAPARSSRSTPDALERIALALLEREVLDGGEVSQLIDGKELRAFQPPSKPLRRATARSR